MNQNVIYGINGPVVTVRDTDSYEMMEMVHVGVQNLVGEVIGITDKLTTIQVYEETTGLKPGDPVTGTGAPMNVLLGPGIIDNIFDGIERPLKAIEEQAGAFINRGASVTSLDTERLWNVTMKIKIGDKLDGGQIYATIPETPIIEHRLMLHPDLSGVITEVKPDGEYKIFDTVAVIEDDLGEKHELKLCQQWPIRTSRPVRDRLTPSIPLITGQRIMDTLFPIAKGGTAAIPGGFGTGKTMNQH
ncbi:MAG: V-type ATP synthase subunit A, partial [Ruminococcus sp.]|nr:V-type ATP synthase subunit A [Ruminococcus sp.]